MRRLWRVVAISVVLVVGSLWLVSPNAFGPETLTVIRHANPWYLLICLALVPLWWLVAALRILLLTWQVGTRISLWNGIQIHLAGIFSAAVTPGGLGNSVGSVLLMNRFGLHLNDAVTVSILLLVGELVFFAWATPVAFLYLLFRGFSFPVANLGIIVVLLSLLALAASFLLLFRIRYLVWPLQRLFRLAFLRRFRLRFDRFLGELMSANDSLMQARVGFHLAFFGLSSLYRIPFLFFLYFIMLALHADVQPAIVLAVQIVIHPFASFIPTPGASGFQEVAFSLALRGQASEQILSGTLILWRLVTFYLNLLAAPILCGAALLERRPANEPVPESRG